MLKDTVVKQKFWAPQNPHDDGKNCIVFSNQKEYKETWFDIDCDVNMKFNVVCQKHLE